MENAPKGPFLNLWLLYKEDFRRHERGTAILTEEFNSIETRKRKLQKLKKKMEKEIGLRRIWQAKIYEHPGNIVIDKYNEPDKDFKKHGKGKNQYNRK